MDKRFIAEKWFAIERRMHPFRRSRGDGRPITADTLGDPLFQWLSTAVGLGVVGLLVLITVILTLAAQNSIRTFGLGFLTGNVWNPVPPLVFGAVPFVYGTLVTSALAPLAADPADIRRRTARRGAVRRVWTVGDLRPRPGHAGLGRAGGPKHLRVPAHLPGKSHRDGQVHGGRHPRGHDHPNHFRGVAGGPPRGPGQSARGRVEPRRHPLGDDARRGPAVRPCGDLRGDHPRPRTGGWRDDGRHDDDREPQRDFL